MMNKTSHFLDFEKPLSDLNAKIEELQQMADSEEGAKGKSSVGLSEEVFKLKKKHNRTLIQLYQKLEPWHKVQIARHPERPRCKEYLQALIEDFTPLAGDRLFGEDEAIIGGLGRFKGRNVVVMGHERGGDTQSRLKHNFGMANPEGYRKAIRLMDMADRFGLPVLCFVDTPGAYPGIGAEERGQSEAIAKSIEKSVQIQVPLISCITGEGGSGGAIALATSNTVMMLANSVYSVISPEGCASILWRDAAKAKDAATALKITAQDLKLLEVIDDIVSEPVGGAHRQPNKAIQAVGDTMETHLIKLEAMTPTQLQEHRAERFLKIGQA